MEKVYKIQNKDGMFSTGGCYPRFTKVGKTWTSFSKIKQHLTMLKRYTASDKILEYYKDCKIIEFQTTPTATMDVLSIGD